MTELQGWVLIGAFTASILGMMSWQTISFTRAIRLSSEAVNARLDGFREATEARFHAVDARFDAVDARFTGIETRLGAVDTRLGGVEQKIEGIDRDVQALTRRVFGADPH